MDLKATVKDVLIGLEEYPHIGEDRTLSEAVATVRSFTCGPEGYLLYNELLVLNARGELSGKVTLQGILAGLEPDLFGPSPVAKFEGTSTDYPNLTLLWEEGFVKRCRRSGGRPVKEFLTPLGPTVKTSDPVLKALYVMVRSGERCLPALEGATVAGMVRLKELFNAVSESCGF